MQAPQAHEDRTKRLAPGISLEHGPDADLVMGCAFSADGSTLVSAADDGKVRVWDVSAEKVKHTFRGGMSTDHVTVSPDGTTVAVMGSKYSLYDLKTGERVRQIKGDGRGMVAGAGLTSGAETLVVNSGTDILRVFDVASGKRTGELKKQELVAVAIAPDDRSVAVLRGLQAQSVAVFDLPSLQLRWETSLTGFAFDLAWTPAGIFVSSTEGLRRVQGEGASLAQVAECTLPTLHMARGSSRTVLMARWGPALIFDDLAGPAVRLFEEDGEDPGWGQARGALSPNGSRFAFAWGTSLRVWDLD